MKTLQFLFVVFLISSSTWVSSLNLLNEDSDNVELAQDQDLEDDTEEEDSEEEDSREKEVKNEAFIESTYNASSETAISGKRSSTFNLQKENLSEFNLGVALPPPEFI